MKEKNTALQEAISEKNKLYKKLKELNEIISNSTDASERINLTYKAKLIRDMYREACDRVAKLAPNKKKRRTRTYIMSSNILTWDFFDRNNETWSDIEGYTWNTLGKLNDDSSAYNSTILVELLNRALTTLTDKQREYIILKFNYKKKIIEIAAEYGVNKSSVSRVIKNGIRRLEDSIISSLYALECIEDNTFDHMKWANNTNAMTERQRELLYYLLTDNASFDMISRHIDVNKSTVSRANERICQRLTKTPKIIADKRPARIVKYKEWKNKTEMEVAEELGISKSVYYRNICRKQSLNGLSRFAYECLVRRDRDINTVATELGCRPETVRKYWEKYKDIDISTIEPPEEYHPKRIPKEKISTRRLLASSISYPEGTIGASVSAEIYHKMLRISNK